MFRVLLVADTHLGPGQGGRLVERIEPELRRADAIVHAGDITDASVLDALALFAPVHAVRGNNDVHPDLVRLLPERTVVDLGGCEFAIVHDSGPSSGRRARLRRWFPTADVVVFGHSHIPWHETEIDAQGHVQQHVNPGSAMQRRRQPRCTVATVEVDAGVVMAVRHVPTGMQSSSRDRKESQV
jgi:putative phosphoesterase